MTGIEPTEGGRITVVDPAPETGGTITPFSGIGRPPVPASGPPGGPLGGPLGGKVGDWLCGRTTSGTGWLRATLSPHTTTPKAVSAARLQDTPCRSATRARAAPRR